MSCYRLTCCIYKLRTGAECDCNSIDTAVSVHLSQKISQLSSNNDVVVTVNPQQSGRSSLYHGKDKWFISSPNRPDWLRGPPDLLFSGYRVYVLGVKLPGRAVEHSRPSSAEVKNYYSNCTSALSVCLGAVDRGSFILLPTCLLSKQHHCLVHVFIPSRLVSQNKCGIYGFRTFQFVKRSVL